MKLSTTTRGRFLRGCVAALVGLSIAAPIAQTSLPAFADSKVNVLGAGSTFDYPFFVKAFAAYQKQNSVLVNYQGVGSGAGVNQFTARTVDFGATDLPMTAAQIKTAEAGGNTVLQFPVALGAVAMAYNLPGVNKFLNVSPDLLVGMFEGKITSWNDAALAKLNPGVTLPNLPITIVHRSDSSGTTYVTTDYLSTVSSDWSSAYGRGKTVNWPTASVGGKGNFGVAAAIKQTPGAFGYVELAYAQQTHMTYFNVENKAGKFIYPNQKSTQDAAAAFPAVSTTHFSIVNAAGATSYPITTYSWVVLYQKQKDAAKGKALRDLFVWLTSDAGQKYASSLAYVPLPKQTQKLASATLAKVSF